MPFKHSQALLSLSILDTHSFFAQWIAYFKTCAVFTFMLMTLTLQDLAVFPICMFSWRRKKSGIPFDPDQNKWSGDEWTDRKREIKIKQLSKIGKKYILER